MRGRQYGNVLYGTEQSSKIFALVRFRDENTDRWIYLPGAVPYSLLLMPGCWKATLDKVAVSFIWRHIQFLKSTLDRSYRDRSLRNPASNSVLGFFVNWLIHIRFNFRTLSLRSRIYWHEAFWTRIQRTFRPFSSIIDLCFFGTFCWAYWESFIHLQLCKYFYALDSTVIHFVSTQSFFFPISILDSFIIYLSEKIFRSCPKSHR